MSRASLYILEPHGPDRHHAMRVLSVLEAELTAFQKPTKLLDAIDRQRPTVVLSEVQTPELTGLDLQPLLLKKHPAASMIFTTVDPRVPNAVEAMKRGAIDFLQKPVLPADLLRAANEAMELARTWQRLHHDRAIVLQRFRRLNERERRLMPYLVHGSSNKEIASDLAMSVRSVEHYRRLVLEKMETPSALKLLRSYVLLNASSPRCLELFRRHLESPRPLPHCPLKGCLGAGEACQTSGSETDALGELH